MQIVSVASAFPKHYYPQTVLLQALQTYWGAELENPEILHRLHRNSGIEGRYLALPIQAYPRLSGWGEMNDLWIEVALDLGKLAICRALTDVRVEARNLGAFFFTSVTGIASPSIDALLVNRLGLSSNIRRVPNVRPRLRGGSGGNCSRSRLREGLSFAAGGSAFR
jgi:alkylresorcinol/alkylpyrone synthase